MASYLAERQAVADMCRRMAAEGFFSGTGGNIGLRLADTHFAVTPSATEYAEVRADDVAVLRLDTLEKVEGDRKPSVEKGLHAAMLRAYPERRASLHTHQPLASAVALLHVDLPWPPRDIPKGFPGGDPAALGARVALVPYRPSGTGMLVKALTRSLKPDIHAYLLASHGVICSAADLEAAAGFVRRIEAAAAHFLRAPIDRRLPLDQPLRTLVYDTLTRAETNGA
jgi:L-fuculose-phosphate aldolase